MFTSDIFLLACLFIFFFAIHSLTNLIYFIFNVFLSSFFFYCEDFALFRLENSVQKFNMKINKERFVFFKVYAAFGHLLIQSYMSTHCNCLWIFGAKTVALLTGVSMSLHSSAAVSSSLLYLRDIVV